MATEGSADVQVIPGPEATWTGQKSQGVVSSRTHTIVFAKNGGTFVQGNKIRFEIPSQDYWDTSLFTISGLCQLFAGANNFSGFPATNAPHTFGHAGQPGADPIDAADSTWLTTKNGIQSLINRVRILQGSMVIADVQSYGKLNRILKLATMTPDAQKHIDFINEGVFDPEDWEQKKLARDFYGTQTGFENKGRYFNLMINTGFIGIDKYFPTKYTGQITFEIYLESNENALVSSNIGEYSDGGMPSLPTNTNDPLNTTGGTSSSGLDYPNGSYQLTDLQAHTHFVVPIDEYDQEMLATIESQGLTVMYDTWTEHTRQITSTGRSTHNFQERAVSVRGGLGVMENSADLTGRQNEWQFAGNNCNRFQWKLGNMYVPAQPVECQDGPGRALAELQDFLNITGDPTASMLLTEETFLGTRKTATQANLVGGITAGVVTERKTYEAYKEMRYGNSLPNNFMLALNLEKSPGQLSGFNTSATNVDIELRLELASHFQLDNMPTSEFRTAQPSWAVQNAGHTFQPSKIRAHDRTLNTGAGWYSGIQPDDRTFNGEGHGRMYYAASEDNSAAAGILGTKPVNRFPESTEVANPGAGIANGGISSTSFMYTKAPSNFSQLTFWANVDAQLNIIRVGQLEVLR